jgi:hypothetical protein
MNLNLIKTKLSFSYEIIRFLVFSIVISSMLFARPFVGIEIFSFRLGEILTGIGLVLTFGYLLTPKKILIRYGLFLNDLCNLTLKCIVITFFITGYINDFDLLNTYTYKSSSYIWSLGFLFLGLVTNIKNKIKIEYYFFVIILVPFFAYLFSSGNYPNVIIDFFKENSDKFQFLKASDVFIGYISVNFLLKYFIKSQNRRFFYFLISSSLFLPVFLYTSRGSFLGVLIYMAFEFIYSRRYIINNKRRIIVYLLISGVVLSISVLRVDRSEFARAGLEEYLEISNAAQVTDSLGNILKEKENVTVWMSFYWHYGRLESTDPTTNWRLDIWQDVVYDLVEENRVLLGYGYNEIFPQMLDPEAPGRLGKDGLNENVHNYFVNIIGRGGIIQLILFILFHYSLVTYWKENVSNYQILMYIVPSFVVSSLDITMEGVQYPLIYYFFLYYFLKNSTKVKVVELYG